ncbi:MAG: hypothetical protein U0871_25125 [Gemmataceae bacterium]
MTPAAPYVFRLEGGVFGTRRLVDAAAAFTAHCRADPKANPDAECYMSMFRYGPDFRAYLTARGSSKGFAGPCWSPWLWIDVDRPYLAAAAEAARRLAGVCLDRYRGLDEDALLVFSPARRYHLGLPLGFRPPPAANFPAVCRELAAGLAAAAGTPVDLGIYKAVQPLRAPNSRHPATGRHKRRLTIPELMHLSPARHAELATEPFGFDPPAPAADPVLAADWAEAAGRVAALQCHRRKDYAPGESRLQRATLDFLREGAAEGERAVRLFRAAADLAEHGGPHRLVELLLTEAALDTGLPPAEVRRVIGCGVAHAERQRAGKDGAP